MCTHLGEHAKALRYYELAYGYKNELMANDDPSGAQLHLERARDSLEAGRNSGSFGAVTDAALAPFLPSPTVALQAVRQRLRVLAEAASSFV